MFPPGGAVAQASRRTSSWAGRRQVVGIPAMRPARVLREPRRLRAGGSHRSPAALPAKANVSRARSHARWRAITSGSEAVSGARRAPTRHQPGRPRRMTGRATTGARNFPTPRARLRGWTEALTQCAPRYNPPLRAGGSGSLRRRMGVWLRRVTRNLACPACPDQSRRGPPCQPRRGLRAVPRPSPCEPRGEPCPGPTGARRR